MLSFWRLARGFMVTLSILTPVLCVQFTNPDYSGIKAGENFEITWTGDGSVVLLALVTGESNNLQPVMTIGSTATSPYTWTVPSTLVVATYAFSISQSGLTNYSPKFEITGGTPTSAATSASPTPLYVAHGLLGGTNGSLAEASGTGDGVALPTGSSRVGQYDAFEGAAGSLMRRSIRKVRVGAVVGLAMVFV
ncbi:HD domain-containing protein [Physcia stellaris]|nr:HD domain-containing protein [Physcia stellaris]